MSKYKALENLNNGIGKGDVFDGNILSPFIINELVRKGRIERFEEEPISLPVTGKIKKRKYTKKE